MAERSNQISRSQARAGWWIIAATVLVGVLGAVTQLVDPPGAVPSAPDGLTNTPMPASVSPSATPTPAPSGPAVKVTEVRVDPSRHGFSYVFAEEMDIRPDDIPVVGSPRYDAWARELGGISPYGVGFKLVLEGNRPDPVRILDMVPVAECTSPVNGTLLYAPPQGAEKSIPLEFDLDQLRARPLIVGGHQRGRDYFTTHTVTLEQGEQQVLQVAATTQRKYCEFHLQLAVFADGRTVPQKVDNYGRPFRVSAIATCSGKQDCPADGGDFAAYQEVYAADYFDICPGFLWLRQDPRTFEFSREHFAC